MISRRTVLAAISLPLPSRCGFKLRGQFDLPDYVQPMFIETRDLDLKESLTDAFNQSGITVVEDPEGAAVLRLIRSEFKREVRTTDASGRATAYTFRYEVDFEVDDNEGGLLRKNQSIIQTRFLDYDPNEELQAEEEEEFLRDEMEQEIGLQLLRRISRM